MVDQLAEEYAGQNVVFIEYDVDQAPSSRYGRWWAAYNGTSVTLPLVMVDSGNQISNGYKSFYTVYKGMVDTALARSPAAAIQAYWWRSGDKVQFSAEVTNLSGVTLSASNDASVHAIVYEDAQVNLTQRFARAAVQVGITSLAPNATETFTLETADLDSEVNWDQLHFIVLVDYRPDPAQDGYDMLQAAVADPLPTSFAVQPETLTFLVDSSDSSVPAATLSIEGAEAITWTASASAPWLAITPAAGGVTTEPAISIDRSELSSGWQSGTVTFTAGPGGLTDQVTVNAFYGAVTRVFLPLAVR